MTDPFAAAASSAARLAELTGQARHDVAVVLGSGWSPAADALASGLDATVTEIPVRSSTRLLSAAGWFVAIKAPNNPIKRLLTAAS